MGVGGGNLHTLQISPSRCKPIRNQGSLADITLHSITYWMCFQEKKEKLIYLCFLVFNQ